jgi:hypothetical protein
MQVYKLGKKPVKVDKRTLKFAKYRMPGVLPTVPPEVSWVTKVQNWPMLLNDQLGDCTIACAAHQIEQWTAYAGVQVTPTDQDVLAAYEAVGGYVPGNPNTDNGCYILDVLNYWKKTGIAGHKITAFVQVNQADLNEVREAIYLFGNVYMGVALPVSVQGADMWTVGNGGPAAGGDNAPGGWGGHAIPVVAMSPETLTCITWGSRLKMSHNFFLDYTDELYAVVSQDWIEANGLAPSQFNMSQLLLDLGQLK